MVISFFGGERANVSYLLANPTARVIRGDPDVTQRIINSLTNKQRFCSGAMTYEEMLSVEKCNEHWDEFVAAAFPGLPKDAVNTLVVQHTDKARTELHFDIPEVDVITGCQMTVYFDSRDRRLFNALRDVINIREGYSRPDDPARKRMTSIPLRAAQSKKDFMVQVDRQITNEVAAGRIKNRRDVVRYLESEGLDVKRSKKGKLPDEYLKIKRPEDEKFTGLRGAYYRADFTPATAQTIGALPAIPRENELAEAQQRLAVEIERRAHRQRERHEMAIRAAERRTKKIAKNVTVAPPTITEIVPIVPPRLKPILKSQQRQETTHDEHRITNPFSTIFAKAGDFTSRAGAWFGKATQAAIRVVDGLFQPPESAASGAESLGNLGSALDHCCQRLLKAFGKLDAALERFEDEDGGSNGLVRSTPTKTPPVLPAIRGPG